MGPFPHATTVDVVELHVLVKHKETYLEKNEIAQGALSRGWVMA